MKQIILLSLLFVIVLLIGGCGNNPQSVAKSFFSAVSIHDYTSAAKFVAKDSQQTLEYIKERFDSMSTIERQDSSKLKYKVSSSQIDGKQAVVTFEESVTDASGKSNGDKPITRELKMVNENGTWKVELQSASDF